MKTECQPRRGPYAYPRRTRPLESQMNSKQTQAENMIRTSAIMLLAASAALLSACSTQLAGGLKLDSNPVRFEVVSVSTSFLDSIADGGGHYYPRNTNDEFIYVLLKITNTSGAPIDGFDLRPLRLEADNWSKEPVIFLRNGPVNVFFNGLLNQLKPGESVTSKVIFHFPRKRTSDRTEDRKLWNNRNPQ